METSGLSHFLGQTDALGKTVLALLLIMSVASWYLILTKAFSAWWTRHRSAKFPDVYSNATNPDAVMHELAACNLREPYSRLTSRALFAREHHAKFGAGRPVEAGSMAEFVTRTMRRVIDEENRSAGGRVSQIGHVQGSERINMDVNFARNRAQLPMAEINMIPLIWMFDCFVGFYLTLPHGRFSRWKQAWKLKTDAGASRLNFDLHRAGGLWFWALLLMLALSGVSFNLYKEVFEPVVSAVSPITPTPFDTREDKPPEKPITTAITFDQVLARAQREAQARGLPRNANGIFYSSAHGIFGVGFGEEHAIGLGSPWLYFDGLDGRFLGAYVPGEGTAGDIFRHLQFPLHSGQIGGLPMRILISLTGIAVAVLSITGVVIWLRKRRTESVVRNRAASAESFSAAQHDSLRD